MSTFDEYYQYDRLNRLRLMQRGTLNGTKTGVSGTPTKEQDWTLDKTGNWNAFVTKTSGTTDLNQTRGHDRDNQIEGFAGTPTWATPPSYDPAGNMTVFPQPAAPTSGFVATYDAWNRLTQITDGTNTIAKYSYDGSNRRTVKQTYTAGTLSETRHFYFTSQWQDVEERVGTSTSADQQYVWGIRYVDELVCRDKPSERLYALQDANFNLTAITNSSGAVAVQERYVFTPYGERAIYDASWNPLSSSAFAWVIGHQGLMSEVETGLINNRNRIFNLVLGRFLQRDSDYVDSNNLFEYEIGNPIVQRDSDGENVSDWFLIGPFWAAVPFGSGDPFYHWVANRDKNGNYNVGGTSFGNAVQQSAAAGRLRGDAINQTDHDVRSAVCGLPCSSTSQKIPTPSGSANESTKNIDSRDLYVRIGGLHADWASTCEATCSCSDDKKMWTYHCRLFFEIWDDWHFDLPADHFRRFKWFIPVEVINAPAGRFTCP